MNRALSAGIVLFRTTPKRKYLVLLGKFRRKYTDIPKGMIEAGETPLQTAKREVEEETGITDVNIIPGFQDSVSFRYTWEGQPVRKKVIYFVGETKTSEVVLEEDRHYGYEWLTFAQMQEQLTFVDQKKLLKKVDEFLNNTFKKKS